MIVIERLIRCSDKVLLHDVKNGNMPALRKVLEENIAFYTEKCIRTKEDHELYQGITQALLAILEVTSPSKS